MRLRMLLKSLAAAGLTAVASYGCTITPAVPAAQMARVVRPGSPPVTSMRSTYRYRCHRVAPLNFDGLFNAYPLVATFGPSASQPGTIGITLADSGAPLQVLPFSATGMAVLEATDSSGQTTTAMITVYFYGISG